MTELGKNARDNPSLAEVREDFDAACESLVGEFQDLERHVSAAVTQLIVDVFRESTQPLDRLVKGALSEQVGFILFTKRFGQDNRVF